MRIALDAMGSDTCPQADVAGGVLAARELGHTVLLVGDEQQIKVELSRLNAAGLPIEIVHAEQQVLMTDTPAKAGKEKPRSSMHVGMELVNSGAAEAFVTAGNTGAALAIATLHTDGIMQYAQRHPAECFDFLRLQFIGGIRGKNEWPDG